MDTFRSQMPGDLSKEIGRQSVRSTDTSTQEEELASPPLIMAAKDLEAGIEPTDLPQDSEHNGNGLATRISTKSSWIDPGPPPDGGLTAWSQAFFCHLVVFNTWGFINSFGVFQTYYVTALNREPSVISWIGSIQVFLLFFIGTFTGRLTDAGYFRPVIIAGAVTVVFGVFMASLSTQYWQLFLAQGVCVGIGNGFLFCPAVSLLSTYFSKKRGLALAIGASGTGTGAMVFPAMVQRLLPRIGFPWTMRALGFIQLGCLAICCIGMRPRVPPRRTGALVDWASFKEPQYSLFAIGMFFNFWGLYFAFYYLGSFARDIIGVPFEQSVNLLITLNGIGVVGRIVPGFLADRFFGVFNTMVPVVLMTAVTTYCWIAVSSQGGLYGWTLVYGFIGGGIQSLFPAALSSLTTNVKMRGTRMGMIFTIVSFAVLTGPPIAGQLIQRKNGGYLYAQVFSGTVMVIGCSFLAASRFMLSRELAVKV